MKTDWSAVQAKVDEIVCHPRTGLVAIGFRKDGRPIWPVMGADDDGTDSGKGSDDGKGSSGTKDDGSGDDSSKSDDATTSKDGKKDKKGDDTGDSDDAGDTTYTATEYRKLQARMQAADRRADTIAKELKELKDKDKPAEEKLKAEHQEAISQLEKERETNKQMRIQLAFLRSNDVQWHDPEDALTMADLSDVEIDKDGNVDGKALKAALKDLAKRKPHLVKTAKKSDDDDADKQDDNGQGSTGTSGSSMSGSRKGSNDKSKPTREELAKRFPALRKR